MSNKPTTVPVPSTDLYPYLVSLEGLVFLLNSNKVSGDSCQFSHLDNLLDELKAIRSRGLPLENHHAL